MVYEELGLPHDNAAGGLVSGGEVVRVIDGPATGDLDGVPVGIAGVRGAQLAQDERWRGDLAAGDEVWKHGADGLLRNGKAEALY